jgi:plasmid stability protein
MNPVATLNIKKVPDDLYKALRKQARKQGKSIAQEVLTILKQNIPTARELARRQRVCEDLKRLRARKPLTPDPFPSAEEMIREDRER